MQRRAHLNFIKKLHVSLGDRVIESEESTLPHSLLPKQKSSPGKWRLSYYVRHVHWGESVT